MNLKPILFVAGIIALATATASCRPAPLAMPLAAATPQAITQEQAPPLPPPPGYAPPPAPSSTTTTVQGTVRGPSYGPAGDLNGFVLDQGTEVHVPPDQVNQLSSVAPVGARVQVSGWIHSGPLGDTHLDATTVTNLSNRNTVAFETPPPPPDPGPLPPRRRGRGWGPPPPPPVPLAPPPPAETAVTQQPSSTLTGTIQQFNYGPSGEVSGFLLSNGTQVNFPPEFGEQVRSLVGIRLPVTVTGYQRQGLYGKTILDLSSLTAKGQTIAISAGGPPPPR